MITAFHTMAINIFFSRNLLNFLKIQVILAGVSRKKCDSPFLKVGFFREKPTLGYPIDFLRIFFRIFSEFFLKKSHLGLKKNIMKEKSEKKLKIIFFKIFFSDFFLWSPKVGFSGKGPLYGFFFRFFFHYKLNCEL